jgi:short subunit dehydrogenase-like uncharacterized protein
MLSEAALALAGRPPLRTATRPGDGVLTPATGIGGTLVERLRAASLELSVRRL